METKFDPKSYWQSRLERKYTYEGVGSIGLGISYNKLMYGIRKSIFFSTLKRHNITVKNRRVLDIGSGTGFYIRLWKQLQPQSLTGIDITHIAVSNLSNTFPDNHFYELDISSDLGPIRHQQFDIISCFDVLYHIVDSEKFEKALSNIHSLLAKDGHFLFTDNFTHSPTWKQEHFVLRSLKEYENLLEQSGFKIISRRPVFFFMNTPVDQPNWILQNLWRFQTSILYRGDRISKLLGYLIYPFELIALKLVKEGPSTEIMLCTKVK